MTTPLVVLVTVGSAEEGIRLGEALVSEKLAACVNLIPGVRSIYVWEGNICNENEVLLLIKTTEAAYGSLEARVKELHTYSAPEIIALRIDRGSDQYLAWLTESAAPDIKN
jgi:periplasmic divalent cation tolerance protein